MTETFRTIANNLNWEYSYGRADFHNLEELDQDKIGMFVDPITTETKRVEGYKTHSGRLMLVLRSDIDQVYDGQREGDTLSGKWKTNIEPIKETGGHLDTFEDALICLGNMKIERWSVQDVINYFDINTDGIILSYQIKEIL